MSATREEIRGWLMKGQAGGATHMVVVCDTFEYENFPVYVMPGTDVNDVIKDNSKPNEMLRVDECYSYALPLEAQLAERRAYHLEGASDVPIQREPKAG